MPPELQDEGQDIFPMGDEAQGPSGERDIFPMGDEETPTDGGGETPPAVETKAATPPPEEKWGFKWNDKEISGSWVNPEDRAKLSKWAQMGYDYAQRMQMLKADKEKWDNDPNVKRYREIDDFVKQNPDWWEHVENNWKTRDLRGLQGQGDLDKLKPFIEKVSGLERTVQEFVSEKQARIEAEEDKALEADIKAIGEKYPYFDFKSVDESGKSLEARIVEHAVKANIPTFKAAFFDLYHDQIIERATEAKKSESAKKVQHETKQGLLGRTPTPTKGLSEARNIKSKSYNDLHLEALSELGINQ